MEPNILLLIKLFDLIKIARENIQAIKDHDPAAYQKVTDHHVASGVEIDAAVLADEAEDQDE